MSVIIPTYNRKEQLKKCLKSLSNQTCRSYEVLVIDNNSTDSTSNTVETLKNKFDDIIYLKCKKQGPSAARNLGIKHTKGDLIVLLDDDCKVNNDWLDKVVKSHKDNKPFIIGGEILNEGNIFTQTVQISQVFWFSTIHTSHIKTLKDFFWIIKNAPPSKTARFVNFLPSNNLSFKRSILKDISFDELFLFAGGEDLDLCQTLKDKGCKLWYDPTIKVKHNPRLNFFSFIKKHFLYGKGFGYFKRKHANYPFNIPDSFSNSVKFFFEPLFIPFVLSFSSNQIKYKTLCFPLFFLQEISFRIGFLNGYYNKSFKASQPVIK